MSLPYLTNRVSDNRLEELREAYDHLATHPTWTGTDRSVKDAEHAALFAELQEHRERVCRECEGRTYVPNPKFDGEGSDPEDMTCPRCNGVGYEPPYRAPVAPNPAPLPDPEEPF